jgi:hypothetical protein
MTYLRLLLMMVTLAGSTQLGVRPEDVARCIPASSDRTEVEEQVAVACCADGSFWFVWGQESRSLHAQPEPEGASPNVGLFCKCVAADGQIIVPPTRVVPSVFVQAFGLRTIDAPSAFIAVPEANGGVVILSAHPKDHPVDRGDRAGEIETGQTDFMSIDRKGRVKRVLLDHLTNWMSSRPGGQLAASVWSWGDSTGVIHCIVVHEFVFPGPAVRCATVTPGGEGDELQASDVLYYPARSPEDSAWFVGKNPGKPVRRNLGWTLECSGYSAVAQLENDVLLVAYDAPHQGARPWRNQSPGDTLTIYKLHEADLSLIDSTRVVATKVAGRDYAGAEIPQALLQRTADGYVFYVGDEGNTRSYSLDASGKPVFGGRAQGAVEARDSCPKPVQQFVSVSMIEPGRPEVPPQIHWFGISNDGRLCHEIYAK